MVAVPFAELVSHVMVLRIASDVRGRRKVRKNAERIQAAFGRPLDVVVE